MLAPDARPARGAVPGLAVNGIGCTSITGGGRVGEPARWMAVAVVLVLIAAGALAWPVASSIVAGPAARPADGGSATSLARVQRRTLSRPTQFNGTLGYAGSYTVLGGSRGTVTWLPQVGAGGPPGAGAVSGGRGAGGAAVRSHPGVPGPRRGRDPLTGADVAQLNHDLVTLGYLDRSDVDAAWDEFSWATMAGVEKLQRHLGVDQTGDLSLGDVVFLPTAARVTALRAGLGGPATGPVLQASSTARTVSVALDPDRQSEVEGR